MKKSLHLSWFFALLVVLISTSQLSAQNSLSYTEDFTLPVGVTPPTGWSNTNSASNTSANASWKFGPWSGTPNYAMQGLVEHTGTSGSQFAWVDGSTPSSLVSILETKSFDFYNHWNLELEFWHASYNTNATSGHNDFYVDYYDGLQWHTSVFAQKGSNPSIAWVKHTIDLSSMQPQGNEQIKLRFRVDQNAATAFYNDIAIDDIVISGEEAMLGLNNAAATGARDDIFCPGVQDVYVGVSNRGTNQISTVQLNWMLNGVLQTPVTYNGTLDTLTGTGPSSDFVNLGQANFQFAVTNSIKYWTSMPNGVLDTVNDNDTISFTRFAGLQGLYVIGGSNGDFPDIDSAIRTVNNTGICGDVTFSLIDGMHIPSTPINKFLKAPATSVLTFTSVSNDKSLAYITDTSYSAGTNYTLYLNNANNVNFRKLTISNGSQNTYSSVVGLFGRPEGISFEDCIIENAYTGNSANGALIRGNDNGITDGMSFEDCDFINGSYAILLAGSKKEGNYMDVNIEGCDFSDQRISAIDLNWAEDVFIYDNHFSSNSTYSTSDAVSLSNAMGDVEFIFNEILGTSTWPLNGVTATEISGTQNNSHKFVNNVISLGDTASTLDHIGLSIFDSFFWGVYHNTVVIQGKSSKTIGVEIVDGSANDLYNNIVANYTTGTAVEFDGNGSVFNSNGNCFYTLGNNLAVDKGSVAFDLAAWVSSTGFDQNGSVSVDPMFIDRYTNNFKLCNSVIDDQGVNASISIDLSGNARNTMGPDPGAYEFSTPDKHKIADQAVCSGDTAVINVTVSGNDYIVWNAADTNNTYKSSMAGMYTSTIVGECGSSTDTFEVKINKFVELGNDTNLCANDSLMISADVVNASYWWNDGSSNQTVLVKKPGQYFVRVLDSINCLSLDTIEVTFSTAAKLPNDTTVCAGTSVELDPGTPAGNYTWSNGSTAGKLFVDSSYTYTVTYTDAANCTSMDSTMVTVVPLPYSTFTQSQFSQSNWEFTADDTTGDNYIWSFGDGRSDTGRIWKTVNIYAINGTYKVSLTIVSNLCGSSNSSKNIDVDNVGVDYVSSGNVLSVYPNPSSGILNIRKPAGTEVSNVVVTITNIQGKEVFNNTIDISNSSVLDLNKEDLASGLYNITILSEKEILYSGKISFQ